MSFGLPPTLQAYAERLLLAEAMKAEIVRMAERIHRRRLRRVDKLRVLIADAEADIDPEPKVVDAYRRMLAELEAAIREWEEEHSDGPAPEDGDSQP
jgi:recombinational DNA repair ATPase RecF